MPATIRDVARAAGVSASTVSRALGRPDLVRESTRSRIQDVATRLGYSPPVRSVAEPGGRMGQLGIIVPDLRRPIFAAIVKGAQAMAREHGQGLLIADSDEDISSERDALRTMARQADAIIMSSPRTGPDALASLAGDSRLVLHHRSYTGYSCVFVDNREAIRQAVAHLAALGHRHVCHVGGPAESPAAHERQQGFAEACQDLGLDGTDLGRFRSHLEGGIAAADLVVATDATGAIAYNDAIAIGLITRLRMRGLAVPEDVSVVGFDDTVHASLTMPPMTSVAVPQEDAGRAAVELALRLLDGTADGEHVELPTHLVVRRSTAQPSLRSAAPDAPVDRAR